MYEWNSNNGCYKGAWSSAVVAIRSVSILMPVKEICQCLSSQYLWFACMYVQQPNIADGLKLKLTFILGKLNSQMRLSSLFEWHTSKQTHIMHTKEVHCQV